MMTLAMVGSIVTAPSIAKLGASVLIIVPIAAVVTMIPTATIAAELGTTYPHDGGVYLWVSEALGRRFGFAAVWWEWSVQMIVIPTVLAFVGTALAFAFDRELATNPYFLFGIVIVFIWGATSLNMLGLRNLGKFASIGVTMTSILPGLILIALAATHVIGTREVATEFSIDTIVPDFGDPSSMSLVIGAVQAFIGLEVTAVFVRRLRNPRRQFPIAVAIGGTIAFLITFLSTMSIVVSVPQDQIDIVEGVMQSYQTLGDAAGIAWIVTIVGAMIAIGFVGQIGNLLIGPATGLLASARYGHLPKMMTKMTRRDVPRNLLLVQAVVVTALGSLFVFIPSVQQAYWMLAVLVVMLYMCMYLLMFISAIRLRYKQPNIERPFKIPGGRVGIWIVAGVGVLVALVILMFGFIPPDQLSGFSISTYYIVISVGLVIGLGLPFVVDRSGKRALTKEGLAREHVVIEPDAGDDGVFLDDTRDRTLRDPTVETDGADEQ